jgi:hypothetical protein
VSEPLTPAQWTQALGDRRARWLFTQDDREIWGAHAQFCLRCARSSDVKGDPRRGFCLEHGFMTSDAFPVLCPKYRADA